MRSLAGALVLFAAASALAQEEIIEEPRPRRAKNFSITAAPIRLIHPMVEIDLEYRITDLVSFTVIAAGGKIKLEQTPDAPKVTIYEVGAQASYYLIGDFERGLMLAIEGIYVKLDAMTQVGERAGFGVGPLFGYKIALRSGLTFLAQAGISHYSGEGALENKVACERCVANLNLNVGWSF